MNPVLLTLIGFTASFFASVSSTPIAIRFAKKLGLVDSPDGKRKLQASSVPLVGGSVAFLTYLILGAAWSVLSPSGHVNALWLSATIPGAIIFLVGLYDDIFALSPLAKLGGQLCASILAALLVLTSETHVRLFENDLINIILGVLWIVAITNGFNLIDNTDGHAPSIILVVSSTLTILALVEGQWLVAAICSVLAGTFLGFLGWNWSPARAYLGDSGSLFCGFLLATLALRLDLSSLTKVNAVSTLILIFLVPIIDTSVAVIGRKLRRVHVFSPGHDHLSHRLRSLGVTPQKSVIILLLLSAIVSVLAVYFSVVVASLDFVVGWVVSIVYASAVFWFLYKTKPL